MTLTVQTKKLEQLQLEPNLDAGKACFAYLTTYPTKTYDRQKALRSFALQMALVLTVIFAAIVYFKGSIHLKHCLILVLDCAFLLFGVFNPLKLDRVEKIWMKFGFYLGEYFGKILLVLLFYLAVLPAGLIFRLLGKDLLERKWDTSRSTMWREIGPDSPGTRPFQPF
ncbi:hypothetical protein JNK13_07105 [bacterium]|nr:hypothetical protein [bacterium]